MRKSKKCNVRNGFYFNIAIFIDADLPNDIFVS